MSHSVSEALIIILGKEFKTAFIEGSSLIASGIIESEEEIDIPSYFIVSNSARVRLKNGLLFELSPVSPFNTHESGQIMRVAIRGKNLPEVMSAGNNLKSQFVDCKISNIGLNLVYELEYTDALKRFLNKHQIFSGLDLQPQQINLYKKFDDILSLNVIGQLNISTFDKVKFTFNFVYTYPEHAFSSININFVNELSKHQSLVDNLIQSFNGN